MEALAPSRALPVAVPTVFDVRTLRRTVDLWKQRGRTVGIVPTMGALHEGHLELVRRAFEVADRVLVSIFVNPKQFGPNEDFDSYPRTLVSDAAKLREEAVDLIYAPSVRAMYPDGFASTVRVTGVTEGLCGAHRPGHFDGVTTVVAKLLLQARADVALFGEKDYQQIMTVRRMVADLDIPCRIVPVPTVREVDGLAMSSRNAHLTSEQRAVAPRLYALLRTMAERIALGHQPVAEVLAWGRAQIEGAGFDRVDYLELRAADLGAYDPAREGRLLAAVHLGKVRLIDNVPVTPAG